MIGVDYLVFENGRASFEGLRVAYAPGKENVQFLATCNLIDPEKVNYLSFPTNDSIDVSFRYYQPGEIVVDNQTVMYDQLELTHSHGTQQNV